MIYSPKSVSVTSSPRCHFQCRIEMHFLRGHRFRPDDMPATRSLRDLRDDAARRFRIRGPVDVSAEALHRGFELFEIAVKMSEGVFLNLLGVIAQPITIRQRCIAATVARHQRAGQPNQRCLKRRIGESLTNGSGKIMMLVPCVVIGHANMIAIQTWSMRWTLEDASRYNESQRITDRGERDFTSYGRMPCSRHSASC